MADVAERYAELPYIPNENVVRNAGGAWGVEGLGLVRNDSTDGTKAIVNATNGGRIDGISTKGHIGVADGGRASMAQFGRYEVPIQDSVTTTMSAELACNASGYFRLAIAGDYVVAHALEVVSGTSQRAAVYLLPKAAQYAYGVPTIALPANVTFSAAAGGSNVCEVTITVVDEDGDAIAAVHHLEWFLSDAATGAGITGTSASGTVAAKSASGVDLEVVTAKKFTRVQTLATGIYILEITDTAKTAFYVCVKHPLTGALVVATVLATGDYG